MSKRATPSLVMTFALIEDGTYLLTHKLDAVTQQKVTDALALDFRTIPRLKRSGTEYMTLHNHKYATGEERLLTRIAVKTWGQSKDLTYDNQLQVVRGASRLIVYDNGYNSPFSHYSVMTWDKHVETCSTVTRYTHLVTKQVLRHSVSA